MKFRTLATVAAIALACATTAPVAAGVAPYLRVEYGGNQLRMTDGNNLIQKTQNDFISSGIAADFKKVGTGFGPGASVGLWLFPALRLGATFSFDRSVTKNRIHIPGRMFYADDLDMRVTEFGGEAAVRIERLRGLTLGGRFGQAKAELIEGYSLEDAFGQFYQDATANRTKNTYGGYIGFDQTNSAGVVGFIRAGYQYRDMGRMPSKLVISDGFTTTQATGNTVWLDYSGYYVKLGMGYDFGH